MPETPASTTSPSELSTNGNAANTPKRDEVGGDHEPAAREPVDERAEQEPDDDDREEVRDQERRDPDARLGLVADLEDERDRGEIRAEARARRGEEEVRRTTATGEGGRDGWCSPRLGVTLPPVPDSDYGPSGRVPGWTCAGCSPLAGRRLPRYEEPRIARAARVATMPVRRRSSSCGGGDNPET